VSIIWGVSRGLGVGDDGLRGRGEDETTASARAKCGGSLHCGGQYGSVLIWEFGRGGRFSPKLPPSRFLRFSDSVLLFIGTVVHGASGGIEGNTINTAHGQRNSVIAKIKAEFRPMLVPENIVVTDDSINRHIIPVVVPRADFSICCRTLSRDNNWHISIWEYNARDGYIPLKTGAIFFSVHTFKMGFLVGINDFGKDMHLRVKGWGLPNVYIFHRNNDRLSLDQIYRENLLSLRWILSHSDPRSLSFCMTPSCPFIISSCPFMAPY
jgi:hypothetical protein